MEKERSKSKRALEHHLDACIMLHLSSARRSSCPDSYGRTASSELVAIQLWRRVCQSRSIIGLEAQLCRANEVAFSFLYQILGLAVMLRHPRSLYTSHICVWEEELEVEAAQDGVAKMVEEAEKLTTNMCNMDPLVKA